MSKKIRRIGIIVFFTIIFCIITSGVKATTDIDRAYQKFVEAMAPTGGVTGPQLLGNGHNVGSGGMGAWTFLKDGVIYCVQHKGVIRSTYGSETGLTNYKEGKKIYRTEEDIKNEGEGKHEEYRIDEVINMADTKKYTYTAMDGEKRHFQDIAYILSANISSDQKQDVLWMTKYNLANGGKVYGKSDGDPNKVDKGLFEYSTDIIDDTLGWVYNVYNRGFKGVQLNQLEALANIYIPVEYYDESKNGNYQGGYYDNEKSDYTEISRCREYWENLRKELINADYYAGTTGYGSNCQIKTEELIKRIDMPSIKKGTDLRNYIDELIAANKGTDTNEMLNKAKNIKEEIIDIDTNKFMEKDFNKTRKVDRYGNVRYEYEYEQDKDSSHNITKLAIENYMDAKASFCNNKGDLSVMEMRVLAATFRIIEQYQYSIGNEDNRDQLIELLEKMIEIQDEVNDTNLVRLNLDINSISIYTEEEKEQIQGQMEKFNNLKAQAEAQGDADLVCFYQSYITMAAYINQATNENLVTIQQNVQQELLNALNNLKKQVDDAIGDPNTDREYRNQLISIRNTINTAIVNRR